MSTWVDGVGRVGEGRQVPRQIFVAVINADDRRPDDTVGERRNLPSCQPFRIQRQHNLVHTAQTPLLSAAFLGVDAEGKPLESVATPLSVVTDAAGEIAG
ncbi:MAG TPA: hypothetical protein VFG87_03465 [Amycolatopsis sp.]|nr:hypothetical protein [Amycolatopsis sp.]